MNDDQEIRTAFDNLRRDAAAAVSMGDGLQDVRRRRVWWRRAVVPAFGAALVVLVAVGAAALLRSADPAPAVAITLPTPTTLPSVADTAATTEPTSSSTTPPPEQVGLPPIGARSILVAGEESIYSWTPDGTTLLLDAPAEVVVSDGQGGIVYSHVDSIWRIPAGSQNAEQLAAGRVTLHDVALVSGEPTVIYTDTEGEDVSTDFVHLLALDTGQDWIVHQIGPLEGGIERVSYADGLLAYTVQGDGGTFIDFTDLRGTVDDPSTAPFSPLTGVEDGGNWAAQGLLGPDGMLLYLDGFPAAGVDVVLWDVTTAVELYRRGIGTVAGGGRVRADLDGADLVISRRDSAGRLMLPLLFHVSERSIEFDGEVGVAGSPSIAKGPIAPPSPSAERCDGARDVIAFEPPATVPERVMPTVLELISAAGACDFARLEEMAADSAQFNFLFQPWEPGMLAAAEDGGDPVTLVISQLTGQPFGVIDGGTDVGTVYVWPRVAAYDSWAAATDEDREFLAQLGYTSEDFASFEEFGAYIGWRMGITESGDWLFLTVGD